MDSLIISVCKALDDCICPSSSPILSFIQTPLGCEIIIEDKGSNKKQCIHTTLSKNSIEPTINEISARYLRLQILSLNMNDLSKQQFISSIFEIDASYSSTINSTTVQIFTTCQSLPLNLFLFVDKKPIIDIDVINKIITQIISTPIEPLVFYDNQFISQCSVRPIGAIIIDCITLNFEDIQNCFKNTFKELIHHRQIDPTLTEKLTLSISQIIQSSPNYSFSYECSLLLGKNPTLNLKALINGALYDGYTKMK
ncbi:hypothetical protein CL6EHI_005990 [Entamoeba histolytica]|nr:hypothetical protein CL6EHI_005990 [Entamoeba histolytica]